MALPKRVAVYCGSSTRATEPKLELARGVGRALAHRDITLVYGAGRIGLMGAAADACLGAGGRVVGVIPTRLSTAEVAHDGLTELIVVDSMHARKQLMVGLADAIVALPGGYGTLDELFEAVTWRQLGYHDKPVVVLDDDGYFDALFAFLGHAESEGLLRRSHLALLTRVRDVDELLRTLERDCLPGRRMP